MTLLISLWLLAGALGAARIVWLVEEDGSYIHDFRFLVATAIVVIAGPYALAVAIYDIYLSFQLKRGAK
jgi:hypothetical protein